MIPGPNGTLLEIRGLSGVTALMLTPFAARGITQTLEPISGSSGGSALGSTARETINGELLDLTPSWFRKYQSVISCTDTETPTLDNAWHGQLVEVDCAAELNYLTGETPQRQEVSGTSRVYGHFTYYRPSLIMRVLSIRNSFTEYNAAYSWQIELREWKVPG